MSAISRDSLDYAVQWVEYRMRTTRVPGLVLGIRDGSDVVVEEAFGLADVAADVEMSTNHRFRVASHSKMYTSTAIMQLVEQGRLRLDDAAGDHLPDATGPVAGVTVRQLLNHAGGVFRDGSDIRFWTLDSPFPTSEEVLSDAAANDLVYEPSTRFKYSNVGFALLGSIIESITGTSFVDHVTDAVLGPLGVDATSVDLTPESESEMATGYTAASYGMPRFAVAHVATRGYAPAAGVCTTARDLLEFVAAHFHGDERLLSDSSKREAQHGAWDVGGVPGRYGLGFESESMGGRDVKAHGGGFPGFVTFTAFDPSDGVAVTVLANCVDSGAQALVAGVFAIISASPGPLAEAPEVDPDRARRFTGRFLSEWGATDVAVIGDRLVGVSPDAPSPLESVVSFDIVDDVTLRAVDHLGFGFPGESVTFTFDEDGRASSMIRNHAVSLPPEPFLARARSKYGS